jgi:hypothetical protein
MHSIAPMLGAELHREMLSMVADARTCTVRARCAERPTLPFARLTRISHVVSRRRRPRGRCRPNWWRVRQRSAPSPSATRALHRACGRFRARPTRPSLALVGRRLLWPLMWTS